jgi:hypothetical protein
MKAVIMLYKSIDNLGSTNLDQQLKGTMECLPNTNHV